MEKIGHSVADGGAGYWHPRPIGALVTGSAGYTGAEIAEAVISAMFVAFDDGARPVRQDDLTGAVADCTPLSRSRARDLARLTAWGHANARQASV